jgi:hypothetical protein
MRPVSARATSGYLQLFSEALAFGEDVFLFLLQAALGLLQTQQPLFVLADLLFEELEVVLNLDQEVCLILPISFFALHLRDAPLNFKLGGRGSVLLFCKQRLQKINLLQPLVPHLGANLMLA